MKNFYATVFFNLLKILLVVSIFSWSIFSWPSYAQNLDVDIKFQQRTSEKASDEQSLYQQISELFTSIDERNGLLELAKINSQKALQRLGYVRQTTESLLTKNILAHLGSLPNSAKERDSFIYLAEQHTEQALQALGYYQSNIHITVDKQNNNSWLLLIAIELNQPVILQKVSINVEGDAKTDPAFIKLLSNNAINVGDILHHGHYEQIKTDLIALGLERGYFQGHLQKSQIAINQNYEHASITINYQSGIRYRFGEVLFSDFELEADILSSLVPFEYGQLFTSSALFQLQQQLQQSQYFASAVAVPNKQDLDKAHLPINVALTKAKSHSFDFGVGYATDTEFRISAGWRTPLINRYGHSQETKIEYSRINPKGRFNYSIPLSHPLNDILQFQFTLNDDEYGDISSTYLDSKIANLRLYRNWSAQFYTRFLRERWTLSDDTTEVEYLLPGISISKTHRKGPKLDPTSGFSQLYTIEAGSESANSAIDVIRLYARWRYVNTLAPKHRIVIRSELGAAFIDDEEKDLLAPSLRFFAGGDQSIRGFAYQSLGSTEQVTNSNGELETRVVGGTRLAVGSLEYQYYFTDKLRGILFTDGGNALDKLDFKAVYSVGTGMHYLSPVGPIRLDLGYSISEDNPGWRLHFTLGAEL
ncbi:autotransporter assembly complex protein TamA [Thalassotalea sp. PLHSN55]|uniref:autotransporter assembly complex protein TamA n=1 Tax=Thalassotalea sp. PLHSN55 TaxID=3435888 RepID=UPI003F858735